MDYFDFKQFFKDKYKINSDIWNMDDIDVVDYTGLEYDARTLFYAKIDEDIDKNYNILQPDKFAEKIYTAICNRYGEDIIKALFIADKPLGGKYPEIAKLAMMVAEGTHGFDLYFTNKFLYSYQTGSLISADFYHSKGKEELSELLGLIIRDVYKYKSNNKIIVIDCYKLSYLTDLNTLAKYLKKSINELYRLLYEDEINNAAAADELSESISEIGLRVIDKNSSNRYAKVKFTFPNDSGDIVVFIAKRNRYIIKKTSTDASITYLNELSHFIKNYAEFKSMNDAIEALQKYLSKNLRGI